MRAFACALLLAALAGGCDREVALALPTDGGLDGPSFTALDLSPPDMANNGAGCVANGGMCMADAPGSCQGGTIMSGPSYLCDSIDGGGAVICCLGICTPGQDQTCNYYASMSAFAGHCNAGSCECNSGFMKDPVNGRCRLAQAGEDCKSFGNPSLPECEPGLTCEPGPQPDTARCVSSTAPPCPGTAPASGDACPAKGQSCAYLPNTSCVCSSLFQWQCAV